MPLRISKGCLLQPLREVDAEELYALIRADRERLGQWLRWAASQTFEDTLEFIRETEAQAARNDGFQVAISIDGRIGGVVGFTGVDWQNRSTVVGYWLAAQHEGKGVMADAVRALVEHALRVWELNRVEVRVAAENRRSRAVPERLGFREDGSLRKAERIGGRYHDVVVYSMLRADWESAQKTGDSV